MKTSLITFNILIAAALTGPAAASEMKLEFDGRVPVPQAAALVASAAPSVPAAAQPEAVLTEGQEKGWNNSNQCKTFIYKGGQASVFDVKFQADWTGSNCHTTTITDSNGNYVNIQECDPVSQWYDATVRLHMLDRNLRAGESEEIKFCYAFERPRGSVKVLKSPIEYSQRVDYETNYYSEITLIPQGRKRVDPDASLFAVKSFTYDPAAKEFTVSLQDKLSGFANGDYYSGNTMTLGVELVQDRFIDKSFGSKNFEFALRQNNGGYQAKFKLSDLSRDKDAGEAAGDEKGAIKKFFAKLSLKMSGDAFTDKTVELGKTETIEAQP